VDSPDVELFLNMVKDLDLELDRCLSGVSKPLEAASLILETCQRMRAKELTGPIHYLLGAIEQHARRISNPSKRPETDRRFLGSDTYWSIRLRKDIRALRGQLMGTRNAVN
jgi:hypothetical protein